jgi:hypothetical protein
VPRIKRSASLRVETMESRELLSGALPVLTMETYNAVVSDVENVMGTLAKTHHFSAAHLSLTNLSSRIPFGRQELSPTWAGDLGIYSPQAPRSGLTMHSQILSDLNRYIEGGVNAGTFRVVGTGSAAFGGPQFKAPAVSAASVRIVNNTGLNITVVASLNGTSQRITHQISNSNTALFDFQSGSSNFISINISQTNGRTPPPPFFVGLDRPVGGYFGKSYPVSVFGGYYSVGQG